MNSYDAQLMALRALRTFRGRDGEFWLSFAEQAGRLFGSEQVFLLRKGSAGWNTFCFWPLGVARQPAIDPAEMEEIAEKTLRDPIVYASALDRPDSAVDGSRFCFRLKCADGEPETIALFSRSSGVGLDRNGDLLKRALLFDIPAEYRTSLAVRTPVKGNMEMQRTADPLDVMLCLNEHSGFIGSAMALCNELASRFGCSRVSLGWKDGEYVRMQAMSNVEMFDRKMSIVQALEVVMEECLDQDEELVLPEPEGATAVIREHRNYASRQGVSALLSLPLRLDQSVVAVLSCERDKAFSTEEIRNLRIICDQAFRRLADLKHYDRWVGAVLFDSLKKWGSGFLGTDHTVNRMYGIAASLLLAILLFVPIEYRVEAPFILRTKDLALLSSPFDGYIQRVIHRPGDIVPVGEPLLFLDTRQLEIENSRSIADVQRYMQEEKKAMAQNALADMKVSEALRRQAESKYQMIRFNLDHAEIKAPFSGVVVEGDLEKLLGAPVRKGDVLLKVARLEDLYVEMKVPERDIHEFKVGQSGEVAFISQPGKKFRVVVDRIEPMAVTEQKGNSFLVLGRISESRQGWWRPGMSGLAKMSVGHRHILWILLHRTVDFFYMKLWW
ncbi:MAG TPA: HlyD family efflux transporter periplasmic adaptor subunit [Chlorobaculum sp.]|nr:HlyD family efflux transporter periplasmic adaptor subunit [Chlorobaculum sp.]